MKVVSGLIAVQFANFPGYVDASFDPQIFADACDQNTASLMLKLVQAIAPSATLRNTNAEQPFRMIAPPGYALWVIEGTSDTDLPFSMYASTIADGQPANVPGKKSFLAFEDLPGVGIAEIAWKTIDVAVPVVQSAPTVTAGQTSAFPGMADPVPAAA